MWYRFIAWVSINDGDPTEEAFDLCLEYPLHTPQDLLDAETMMATAKHQGLEGPSNYVRVIVKQWTKFEEFYDPAGIRH
jgi:hypothetical protein